MKKLAQYKKIYLMILIEFSLYIALVIFNFAIRIESTYLLFFTGMGYFPLFSIVYSIFSYKYYKRVMAPFLIYAVLTFGIYILFSCFSMLVAHMKPLEELGYLALLMLATIPFVILSIIVVLILLLSFKTVNILRTKSKKS